MKPCKMSAGLFSEEDHFLGVFTLIIRLLASSVQNQMKRMCAAILACFPSVGPQFFMADSQVIHPWFKIFSF